MNKNLRNLIRPLNSRERRRYETYGMLPVDAIDPECSTRELIESNGTKLLYRYGCPLGEMNLELQRESVIVKRNFIFHLRGSHHILITRLIKSPFTALLIFPFHPERIKNLKRRSIISSDDGGDSLDEQSFIFEPTFVVCVCVILRTNE